MGSIFVYNRSQSPQSERLAFVFFFDQYIRLCEICGEQRRLHSNTEKAIKEILRICQEKKRFDAILDVAGEDSKLLIQRSFSKGTHFKKGATFLS